MIDGLIKTRDRLAQNNNFDKERIQIFRDDMGTYSMEIDGKEWSSCLHGDEIEDQLYCIFKGIELGRLMWPPQKWMLDWCEIGGGMEFEEFGNLEEAKYEAKNILADWMAECRKEWKSFAPTEEERNDWNEMIRECFVEIRKYDPIYGDYEELPYWEPKDEDLKAIGWVEI